MNLMTVGIAGAVTVAVTVKLMHALFLNGNRLAQASLTGRFVGRLKPALRDFAHGWRRQDWRYRLIAYPSMILASALVSTFLYWMLPPLELHSDFEGKPKYALLVFFVGMTASILISFLAIFTVYLGFNLLPSRRAGRIGVEEDGGADETKEATPTGRKTL